MAKQVSLRNDLYDKIKKEKGERSFTDFIENLFTESIADRLAKIEKFLKEHSSGEFE